MEKEQEQEKKEEDPNKKLYDERLAESNRRMFDELALLEQKRKVSFIVSYQIVKVMFFNI